MKRFMFTALLVFIAAFCFSSVLSADEIILKDGRKVEGTIIFKDANKITIQTKYGPVDFKMSEVKEVIEKKTKDQLYEEMVQKTNPRDTKELMTLVSWCKENGMISKQKKHLRQIISLDPNHEEARKLLGYVKHQGKWVTEKEKQKMEEEAAREEKIAAGLVEYNGEWMPKEDVEKLKQGLVKYKDQWVTAQEKERLEKNLVLYEGVWMPKEDAEKRKQGLFKVNEEWVSKEEADRYHSRWETPWRLGSDHILLVTNVPYDMAQKFLAEGEGSYKKATGVFGAEPNLADTKLTIYVTSDQDTWAQVGNEIGDARSSNYRVFSSEETPEDGPVSATFCENPRDLRITLGFVRHAVVEQFFRRLNVKEPLPDWYVKGQAACEERFFHPKMIAWSKQRLVGFGGPIKFKQFFGSFNYTEQEILFSGLILAWLQSADCPESVKERMGDVKKAINEDKKIEIAFVKLETIMVRAEKEFLAFVEKY